MHRPSKPFRHYARIRRRPPADIVIKRVLDRIRSEFIEPKERLFAAVEEISSFAINEDEETTLITLGVEIIAEIWCNEEYNQICVKTYDFYNEDNENNVAVFDTSDFDQESLFFALTFMLAAELPDKPAIAIAEGQGSCRLPPATTELVY